MSGDDDLFVGPDGRLHLGPAQSKPLKHRPHPEPAGYVSPLWPPPGDPRAAHRCERGGPCRCSEPDDDGDGKVIAFPGRAR